MTSTIQDVNDQQPADDVSVADRLNDQLDRIVQAPSDLGTVELVVRRPSTGEREVLESAELRPLVGVVGDNYVPRGDRKTPDGRADPLAELNIMSSRALARGGRRRSCPLATRRRSADRRLRSLGRSTLPPARVSRSARRSSR